MNRPAAGFALRTLVLLACLVLLSGGTSATASPDRADQPRHQTGRERLVFDRGPAGGDNKDVYVANLDGSGERPLIPAGGEGCCARWSHDGTHLAQGVLLPDGFAGTVVYDARTFRLRKLPSPAEGVLAGCPIWSPDGATLACEVFDSSDLHHLQPSGVFTVRSSDGGGFTRLTSNPYPEGIDLVTDYSPDGARMVFARSVSDGGDAALFVMRRDGTQLHRITPWGMLRNGGRWSPDGKWILFNDHEGQIWKVRPNGTRLTKIELDVEGLHFAFEPAWSPDGRQFAFSMWTEALGQDDIYLARADGSHVRQVTNTPDHEGNVDWGRAPVGRRR